MKTSINGFTATKTWIWQEFSISYQTQGSAGPAVVMIHGFGASWWHWRHNIPVLAANCRVYAIDLIGFGGSAKPKPGEKIAYTLENWGQQVADFCREVVGGPAFLVGNSIGCIVAMQAAVSNPEIALGVALLNCSLRLLHDRKRATLPWSRRVGAPLLQRLLSIKPIGEFFFNQVAQPKTVRKILLQAYANSEAVTDELVDILTAPARDPGAVAVFLAFTSYSTGPLPEDLLPVLPCPAIMIWGTADPWEPIALGRELANYPQVQKFIPLEGVGHCPQDEAPELVNPILLDWIRERSQYEEN
ncbi:MULTISPECIES: alpha/beta fold hydrolase [unclassified Tolypothrix]|uniref:alpha/beta fold hydrolase n=1 Tax=unclassified Tolypothrix TaxID=2649714 RepID=UPI0005EAABBC|nr:MULTISPECIES: alpha/beta fold hydrolase [unclassified Tolypothrix]BAY92598.1 alpha/beta hydrolase fold protein [Microchaete diplosiphon NIES-3275]EKF05684.1 hydrolase, alpha/beta fold family protein [Tolypothrix sp. PCC 7601]MBE9084166.1 alpha/beta fold hydrolase [Tolypothrix sp. LEGE 11397]UYD26547.1 alpha/beta fold hydrolase [Tolypothrix sp. PCC 7712]UYD31216.1 alpha/beta fold hydrolase [Tolypothrix sp. PCC 7601]